MELTGNNNLNSTETITATSTGAVLQLNNVSISNPLTVYGTGISDAGELEAVGSNTTSTVSGLDTSGGSSVYIGALPTDTLNLTGGFSVSGSPSLVLDGGGTVNISGGTLPAFAAIDIYNYLAHSTPTTVVVGVAATSYVGQTTMIDGTLQIGNGTTGIGQIGTTTTFAQIINSTLVINDFGGTRSLTAWAQPGFTSTMRRSTTSSTARAPRAKRSAPATRPPGRA